MITGRAYLEKLEQGRQGRVIDVPGERDGLEVRAMSPKTRVSERQAERRERRRHDSHGTPILPLLHG